jgi:hypothetical protein
MLHDLVLLGHFDVIIYRKHASIGTLGSSLLFWEYLEWSHVNATFLVTGINLRPVLRVRWKFLALFMLLTKCWVASVVIVCTIFPLVLYVSLGVIPIRFLNNRWYLAFTLLLSSLVFVSADTVLLIAAGGNVLPTDAKLDLIHVLLLFDILNGGQP